MIDFYTIHHIDADSYHNNGQTNEPMESCAIDMDSLRLNASIKRRKKYCRASQLNLLKGVFVNKFITLNNTKTYIYIILSSDPCWQ